YFIELFLDVDGVFDLPGFEKSGGKMPDTHEKVFQGIVPGVDAPYDVVHPFHQHEGAVLDLVHGLAGLAAAVAFEREVAEDGDGAKRGADVVMKVLRYLIADVLHSLLQLLIGLQLLDQLLLAADLFFFSHMPLVSQTGGEAKHFQQYAYLWEDKDVVDADVLP